LEITRELIKKSSLLPLVLKQLYLAKAWPLKQAMRGALNNFFIIWVTKQCPMHGGILTKGELFVDSWSGTCKHYCSSKIFTPLAEKFHIPVVISGFEPLDLGASFSCLSYMITEEGVGSEIQFSSLVTVHGTAKLNSYRSSF
jgi:hydrogenase expression/formation protein HypD